MPFCWEEDAEAEAEGVVLAVDVTRHARQAGLEGHTFLSRGLWLRCVGRGEDQERRLAAALAEAGRRALEPSSATDDGSAVRFSLPDGATGAAVEAVRVTDPAGGGSTFMLWHEFAHRPAGPRLRVRVVAEDETTARA